MNGLLMVDKPKGISSFDVIRRLRRISGVKKIGHAGTLDPMATGLMLMLFGAATKQAQNFLKLDKAYRAELTLGHDSSTGDAEGGLTKISTRQPTPAEVEAVLNTFIGQITQIPPAHSAVKVGGQRAYKLARRGQKVEIPPRKVTIHQIKLLGYNYPLVEFETKVSSGTYIRSLAADIGRKLGTGGYLSALCRSGIGPYRLDEAINLETATTGDIAASLKPFSP